MRSLKLLGLVSIALAAVSAARAQAPAGTLPTVTAPIATTVLSSNGTTAIDLSTVFGLPSVVGQVVQFTTVLGTLNVELYSQYAPLNCANFLAYVNSGAFNNTVIYRSVPGFVEQGGTYSISSTSGFTTIATAPPVKNEFHVSNTRGTVAMALLSGDANSATDAWFFNLADNSSILDAGNSSNGGIGFTVFARVLGTGMSVIDACAAAPVYDLTSILNAAFATTPLINVPSSNTISLSNFIAIPTLAPISIYPTASASGVLAFSAASSNPNAMAVGVSGRTLALTAGASGSSTITVTATDTNGNRTSTTFTANVSSAPLFTLQPTAQTVANVAGGTTVILTSAASGTPAPTYQWQFNGKPLTLGASARLVIPGATAANAGTYTCVATNSAGTATSNSAVLSFVSTTNVGRLINLSVNSTAGKSQVLTVGFQTGGSGTSGSQNLLLRATGPALAAFGVSNTLADPTLSLFSGATVINSNDNWGTPAANQTQVTAADTATFAFPLSNPASLDAALVTSLTSGGYTVQISGNTPASGSALAEIYDDTPSAAYALSSPRLINLSSSNLVAANGSLTAGFVIGGSTSKSVLIRATGPALTALGVSGAMPDPQLALHTTINGQDAVLAANAGWGGDPQIASEGSFVFAFPLTNPANLDSALLVMLAPGSYTAVASSVSGTAGVALIEVYEVP